MKTTATFLLTAVQLLSVWSKNAPQLPNDISSQDSLQQMFSLMDAQDNQNPSAQVPDYLSKPTAPQLDDVTGDLEEHRGNPIANNNNKHNVVKHLSKWVARRKDNYAIQKASRLGQYEEVKRLLKWEGTGKREGHRVDPTTNDNYAIQMASKNGHAKVVELLMHWKGTGKLKDYRVNPTANNNYALRWALQNGDSKTRDVLLTNPGVSKYNQNYQNYAINDATRLGNYDEVQRLLEWKGTGDREGQRMNPTLKNNDAIQLASKNGHANIVELLLRWTGTGDLEGKRVNPNANNNKAIRWAIRNHHANIVGLLMYCDVASNDGTIA